MGSHKVEHNKPDCIGCAACAAVAPEFWEMNDEGKADLKGCKEREDDWEEKEISQEDYELYKESADSCPVNVIHITDKKTGEKLI